MTISETAAFWDHVSDLRKTVLQAFAVLVLALVLTLYFYQGILGFFTAPLYRDGELQKKTVTSIEIFNTSQAVQNYKLASDERLVGSSLEIPAGKSIIVEKISPWNNLVVFGPIEGMLIALKVSFWTALVFSSPLWGFLLLRYLLPALHPAEKRALAPFLLLSALFIGGGLVLAYTVTIPLANAYLQAFNSSIGTNLWSLSNYLDYTLFLMLANAFAFELAVVALFLVHLGVLSAEFLAGKRRYAIVAAFILGAILTPPDVITQLMLAIPLILLYELTLLYARIKE